jgi:hypothetical protein
LNSRPCVFPVDGHSQVPRTAFLLREAFRKALEELEDLSKIQDSLTGRSWPRPPGEGSRAYASGEVRSPLPITDSKPLFARQWPACHALHEYPHGCGHAG